MNDPGSSGELRAAALLARALDGETLNLDTFDTQDPALRELVADLRTLNRLDRELDSAAKDQIIGDYRIRAEIGRGGMGVVYEAEQTSLDRRVALKVLPPHSLNDERSLKRFRNEARAAASLDHPHIVAVHAVGSDQDIHYCAMQLVDGVSLKRIVTALREDEGATSRGWYRLVANLGMQAADALAHAHELGVLHRDIKPANLLLDATGKLWITDFGLASFFGQDDGLTRSGEVVGTLDYLSPERIEGRLVDERSDVYSLGVTLYELLAGTVPFAGAERGEVLRKIVNEDPPPLSRKNQTVPRDLETIVQVAMRKEPGDRYTTAGEMLQDLRAFLNDQPIRGQRLHAGQIAARWCRRNPWLATTSIGLVVATIVLSLVGYFALQAHRAAARANIAEARAAAQSARATFAPGRRRQSLARLTEAAQEIPNAGLTSTERDSLVFDLRCEVAASLSLWDVAFDALGGSTGYLSPDGQRIVTVDTNGLTVMPVETRKPELCVPGDFAIARLRFSSSQRFLAFTTKRQALHLCDLQGKKHVNLGRIASERGFCWLSKPTRLVFTKGASVYARNAATGTTVDLELRGMRKGSPDLATFGDGQRLLLIPRFRHEAIALRPPSRRALFRIPLPFQPWAVATAPDGDGFMVSGSAGETRVFQGKELQTVYFGHNDVVDEAHWSPDGRFLLTKSWDGTVQIREPDRNVVHVRFDQFILPNIGWGKDSRVFAVQQGITGASAVRLEAPPVVREYWFDSRRNTEWDFVVDTKRDLLITHQRNQVEAFNLVTCERIGMAKTKVDLATMTLDRDGTLLGGGRDGLFRFPIHTDPFRLGTAKQIHPRRVINLRARDKIFTWDAATVRVLGRNGGCQEICGRADDNDWFDASTDGRWAATGPWEGKETVIWNIDKRKVCTRFPSGQAKVAFSPDNRWLFVGGLKRAWVLRVGNFDVQQTWPHNKPRETADGAFSPDGRILAWTRDRSGIILSRVEDGQHLISLTSPGSVDVFRPRFSADGRYLYGTTYVGKILAWDLALLRRRLRDLDLDW